MACTSLAGISRSCGANPGGTKTKIYAARIEDISLIPAATGKIVSADIAMVATKLFVPIDIVSDSGQLQIDSEGETSNPSLKATLTFKIARNNPTIDAAINNYLGQECVFLVPENSGHMRIVGQLDKGAFMMLKSSTGAKAADFAGKECTVTWNGLSEEPDYYTGDVPLA